MVSSRSERCGASVCGDVPFAGTVFGSLFCETCRFLAVKRYVIAPSPSLCKVVAEGVSRRRKSCTVAVIAALSNIFLLFQLYSSTQKMRRFFATTVTVTAAAFSDASLAVGS